MARLLTCGLGGGLDIINASIFYFAAENEGRDVTLGSARPAPQSSIENHEPFADSGTWVNGDSVISYGRDLPRYSEPRVADLLGEDVLFLSRKYLSDDILKLNAAIRTARDAYDISDMLFVDGGGDSLILTPDDEGSTSESDGDPFAGGDSKMLHALQGIPRAYLAAVAVGLDVDEERFQRNVELLDGMGAYFGRVNLLTGEKEDYRLEHLISFNEIDNSVYFKLAELVVAMDECSLDWDDRWMSHTATVMYHALKEHFGHQRTYVPWEPTIDGTPDGEKGVIVKPDHCWAYFFDASKIHEVKLELNGGSSST